jgi:hypothetical protein
VALALALVAPAVAQADILVNTNQDAPADDDCTQSTCKLRDAVTIALRTGETIRVPANTYQLTQGPITLNGVQIVGDGALTTIIDGRDMSGVFRAMQGTNSISGLTITNGTGAYGQFVGGGGILAQTGSLALTDSAVVGNTAPGLGGGIASAATLTLVRTTVAGNVASTGLSGQPGQGGGLYIGGGSASLTNSSVSGNSASTGGNVFNAGQLSINFVTIAADAQGGGINQTPAAAAATNTTISNSIVAGGAGPACSGAVALINATAGTHNVIDDTTCALGGTGDRENVDPGLAALTNNGGQTSTHALVAGSPAIGAANLAACVGSDQRGVARPQEGTCDSGAFEFVPTQNPPSQPPPGGGLPAPVLHEKVNAIPARGTIRVKRPGAKRFRKLADDGAQLPVGTTVDALKGRVTIVAASDGQGGTDTAVFYGGIFKIGQTKGKKPTTILSLTEKLTCPKARSAITAAKKRKRRLWGDGEGKFRTKGKHSAATVVGTKWLVEDRCKSTLTRVVRGRVSVRDFAKDKTVIVRRGKRYIARAG